jgi:hypothetical protein
MSINLEIPPGTEPKFIKSTVTNANLRNRFEGVITLAATEILSDPMSTTQLTKLAVLVAKNDTALTDLATQAIKYAIGTGAIQTSKNTLADNQGEIFDDSTVEDSVILAVINGLIANSNLLIALGHEG